MPTLIDFSSLLETHFVVKLLITSNFSSPNLESSYSTNYSFKKNKLDVCLKEFSQN